MREYIELNKSTYDSLAEEYFERLVKYDKNYQVVGQKICEEIFAKDILKEKMKNGSKINVLELGCGPGAILQALNKYPYVCAYAIDFSEKMVYFAHKSNGDAEVKVADVLEVKNVNDIFGKALQGTVDVLIMAAFIHLFPKRDAEEILKNAQKWLAEDGLIYLDTTEEKHFSDGEIRIKKSLNGKEIKHLRTQWTQKDFNGFIEGCGYRIFSQTKHMADSGKTWMRTILRTC